MKISLETYQFKAKEVIASIGAGGGLWEIGFASYLDDVTFHIQDIDEGLCNQEEIDEGIAYFERQTGKKINCTFIPVIGTSKKTNLPSHCFDKILVINALHEFDFPEEILSEIYVNLKDNGVLFIEEELAKVEGQLHEGCYKRLFTENQLKDLLVQHHFLWVNSVHKSDQSKIISFKKQL